MKATKYLHIMMASIEILSNEMVLIKFLHNEKYGILSSTGIRIRDFPAAFCACWVSLLIYLDKVLITPASG